MERGLNGFTAVVNGAGRGIGRAVAIELARQGARVVVNDLDTGDGDGAQKAGAAQRVVGEITKAGGEALAYVGDIGDRQHAEGMIDLAIDEFGKLDILVNCAGNSHLGTIVDTEPSDFARIMRVHVEGYYLASRRAAKHWVERGTYGRLINCTSMAAVLSHPSLFAYSAAKSAIVGLTRSCANALVSYGVTANVVSPHAATGMTDALTPDSVARSTLPDGTPSDVIMGTINDPAHVAPMVAYLASPSAGHVTGRFLEARGSLYSLWAEPEREREYRGDFLAHPADVYKGIDAMLAGLQPTDLKWPMPPFEELGDWKRLYGTRVPKWDFAGKSESTPSRSGPM